MFYCGLVRTKNALATLMQVYATVCLVCLLWMLYGYSLAFTTRPPRLSIRRRPVEGFPFRRHSSTRSPQRFSPGVYVPEYAYIWFQMTFAAITPALIVGAFAERMSFPPFSCSWRCG